MIRKNLIAAAFLSLLACAVLAACGGDDALPVLPALPVAPR